MSYPNYSSQDIAKMVAAIDGKGGGGGNRGGGGGGIVVIALGVVLGLVLFNIIG